MTEAKRILLVEDTPELREDLALELHDAGYQVIEAGDGRTALAAFASHSPHLVLCDIQLPDVDGISVLAAIRNGQDQTSQVPAIVVSAFSDSDLRDQASRLGIEQFMVKPIDFDDLLGVIATVLGREAAQTG